jgi:hypothetical protein
MTHGPRVLVTLFGNSVYITDQYANCVIGNQYLVRVLTETLIISVYSAHLYDNCTIVYVLRACLTWGLVRSHQFYKTEHK